MDKYDYLKLMIEHRDVWNDDTVEIYFDAHEEYFNIVDYEEEHKIPDEMEITLLIKTFYNIDMYGYLVDSMVERVLLYMELSEENFTYCLDKLFENKKGYYMMVRLFHFLVVYHNSRLDDVIERINKLSIEDKFYLYNFVESNKIVRDTGVFSSVLNNRPNYLKNYEKLVYNEHYVYPETKLRIKKRDSEVLSLVQGYLMYVRDDLFLSVFSDDTRSDEIKKIGVMNSNILLRVNGYYLIEKDGFYYIGHRDQLNEAVYDISVGDSLEKVLESVNLFSWIK